MKVCRRDRDRFPGAQASILMAVPLWLTIIYQRPSQDDKGAIKL